MTWNREQIDSVALKSASADHAAFERIGLTEMTHARVLDIGCFDGFNTVLKLGPYANISEIVGLDPSEEALELAMDSTDDPRFQWQVGTFEDFQCDAPFDLIYMSHVFQHLPDKDAVARKAYDCLKPGGWLVIKSVDDSMKASAPDPDEVMKRVFARYEEVVRPRMAHTLGTDRNNGSACYGILRNAGFVDVDVLITHTSTAGMNREERLGLFERMTYFRNPPIEGARDEILTGLLEEWKSLFERDDYFFDTSTFMVFGRKPFAGGDEAHRKQAPAIIHVERNGFTLETMVEDDLGEVMAIEMRSFPNPWAPLAFALELRHNNDAHYVVARDAEGHVRGYIGWWTVEGQALITHVAVDPAARRKGIGTLLVECAVDQAREAQAHEVRLQLRAPNEQARGLYRSAGFEEVGCVPDYYDNPTDDAVVMALPLDSESATAKSAM